jgi:hypothetical protein
LGPLRIASPDWDAKTLAFFIEAVTFVTARIIREVDK